MRSTALLPVVLLAVPLAVTPPIVAPAGAAAQAEPATGPADPGLFEATDPLQIEIWADFEQLRGDRDQEEEEREGRLRVTAPDGTSHDLSLLIRTRGKFRLERSTCQFPPLRLNLKKGELEGTFLEGQDKLKLVTHCRDRDDYEQNVLEEYLVYRMFNQITDRSFRVRLARMTYHDTSGSDDPTTRWGFLIEDDDLMAERLGGVLLEEEVHPARILGADAGPVTLFQFMVGNTDFSLFRDHNTKLVAKGNEVIPIPYDFDWTGFVDARYARPDPRLGIRDVKQRLYRGLCRADVDYQALYALFDEKRPAIERLIREQVGLEDDEKEDDLEYIEEFYEIINDPGKARRSIEEACRRV